MRAINLIPADERRGAGGAGGRSGGAAHVLVGLLAVLVAVTAYWTLQKRSLSDKQAEVAHVEVQAASSEAQAAELTSFIQFAGLRAARTQTVTSLASSRFDWSHALEEIARVIPANVSLTALVGTVAPGVSLKAGGGVATSSLRSALPVPAVELSGCTTDQDSVARMLTRMRLIDGVTRVSLQSSVKADAVGGGTAGSGAGACRQGKQGASPTFALVVFFDQVAGSVPTTTPGTRRVAASVPPNGTTGVTGATGPATAVPTGVAP
ncbi:MAG: hypothetical protein JWO90_3039 [Solirubrobacterales bacterium]|jgi:Tfp pilus assembly protein PilN|nr:hypothetical protein [Solirubrobacterales bacterium]